MSAAALIEADEIVTKGEAAKRLNVSPGRVSQYITEGKISGEALVGEGRNAKINLTVARRQLRSAIDVGQRFGNGLETRLEDDLPPAAPVGSDASNARQFRAQPDDPVAEAIKREKLIDAQMRNRAAAEAELARRGIYTRTADVSAAMTAALAGMMNVFEGGLSDLASAVAAKFELSQRDVLHLLRTEFHAIRVKAAEDARRRAASMPGLIADDVAEEETTTEA